MGGTSDDREWAGRGGWLAGGGGGGGTRGGGGGGGLDLLVAANLNPQPLAPDSSNLAFIK